MVKAVFFDLFETLVTEWKDGKRLATYSIHELGLEEEIYRTEWHRRIPLRMDGTIPDFPTAIQDILQAHQITVQEDVLTKLLQERIHGKSLPFQNIQSDILDMLYKLKENGILLGLISNCASEEIQAWDKTPLAELFDDVIFSYKVRCAKPSPAIYLLGCEHLGVKPSECLFVGDGGSNELQGATAVGMEAYQATWFLPKEISNKTNEFPKLDHPKKLIELVEAMINV